MKSNSDKKLPSSIESSKIDESYIVETDSGDPTDSNSSTNSEEKKVISSK